MKLIFRNTTSGHNDSDHAECVGLYISWSRVRDFSFLAPYTSEENHHNGIARNCE